MPTAHGIPYQLFEPHVLGAKAQGLFGQFQVRPQGALVALGPQRRLAAFTIFRLFSAKLPSHDSVAQLDRAPAF